MENRFLRLIEVLVRHEIRFIVVGGIAAVLQRVPINTQDFDLVTTARRTTFSAFSPLSPSSVPSIVTTLATSDRTNRTCWDPAIDSCEPAG